MNSTGISITSGDMFVAPTQCGSQIKVHLSFRVTKTGTQGGCGSYWNKINAIYVYLFYANRTTERISNEMKRVDEMKSRRFYISLLEEEKYKETGNPISIMKRNWQVKNSTFLSHSLPVSLNFVV